MKCNILMNKIAVTYYQESEILIIKNVKLSMKCLVLEYFEVGSLCYREQEF